MTSHGTDSRHADGLTDAPDGRDIPAMTVRESSSMALVINHLTGLAHSAVCLNAAAFADTPLHQTPD
jgi:hypothetical protein